MKSKNFIESSYIDKKVCKSLIDYFEKSDQQIDGVCNYQGITLVNKKVKSCIEVPVSIFDQSPEIINYIKELNKVLFNSLAPAIVSAL